MPSPDKNEHRSIVRSSATEDTQPDLHPKTDAPAGRGSEKPRPQRRQPQKDLATPSSTTGLAGVPLALTATRKSEFVADQEVRWCPGCGDYAILGVIQGLLPELGIQRENAVVISGIGCSSRFPYYVDTYGMHSIHGRAITIASGLAVTRPDLAIMVITGDGDALSIGGNHLIHLLRRNINMTVIMFNNRIYGLTKGQFSPTSEAGKVTKSSPVGSVDTPLNAVSVALGAEASFVARSMDSNRKHLAAVLRAAFAHRGSSFVEVYQNCVIFNDDAWTGLTEQGSQGAIDLIEGEPILTSDGLRGAVQCSDGHLDLVPVGDVGLENILIHDPHIADPTRAFALSQLTDSGVMHQAPMGIFRDIARPTFDDLARQQVETAQAETAQPSDSQERLQSLLAGDDPWIVV